MRFRHTDGTTVHLAYCSNVHQAEDLDGVVAQLAAYAQPVRETLGVDLLGIGLWLARDVVTELSARPDAVHRLRTELTARGLETVTLNAFPYGGFHREVVKKDVYLPDWTDPARLRYTVDCARVLAGLLPDDARRGSVSTLPLAWRTPWPTAARDTARRALDQLGAELAELERDTGRTIRVGFEPEPGCVVEDTVQAARELGGWTLSGSASASTPAISRCSSNNRRRRCAASPPPASRSSRSRRPAPSRPTIPPTRPRAGRSPGSPNPASCTRPELPHPVAPSPAWTISRTPSPGARPRIRLASPLPRAAARRARTTAAHHSARTDHCATGVARRPARRLRPRRGRDLHLVRPARAPAAARPRRSRRGPGRRTRLDPRPVRGTRPASPVPHAKGTRLMTRLVVIDIAGLTPAC